MRRLILFLACLTLLIALPAAAQNDIVDPRLDVQQIDTALRLDFFGWSPDGKWIAYFTNDADHFAHAPIPKTATLHLLNLETQASCIYADSPVTTDQGDARQFYAWVAGNRWLEVNQGVKLWQPCSDTIEDLSDRFPTPINDISSISPDGTKIVFDGDPAAYIYDIAHDTVFPISGIVPNHLRYSDEFWLFTSWSSDGTQIAALYQAIGAVYLIDALNGQASLLNEEPIPPEKRRDFGEGSLMIVSFREQTPPKPNEPHYLGDIAEWLTPTLLYIHSPIPGEGAIFLSSGERLSPEKDLMIADAASLGDSVYRLLLQDQERQYYVFYSETGEIDTLTTNRYSHLIPQLSPDGRDVFFEVSLEQVDQQTIGISSTFGAKLSEIKQVSYGNSGAQAVWSIDGQYVVWMSHYLNIFNVDNVNLYQKPIPISDLVSLGAWSPDGRRLAVIDHVGGIGWHDNLLIVTPR